MTLGPVSAVIRVTENRRDVLRLKGSGRGFRGSYLSYVLTYFFFYFCMGLFSSVLSLYLTGLGKSASEMSLIVSASSLFGMVLIPFTGFLCDKTRKPRAVAMVLLILVAVFGLLFAISRATGLLFLLNGLIMGCISSLSPMCERKAGAGKYRYGAVRIWGTFGYAAAAQLAGLILDCFPPIALFLVLTAASLLTCLGFWGMEDVAFEGAAEKPGLNFQFSFLKNPSFLLFVFISFLFMGASTVNMTYTPMLLAEIGVPVSLVGTVLLISTLVEIPLILFSNRFMDRFPGKPLLIVNFAVMLAQFLAYGLSASPAVIIAAMVLLKAISSTLFIMITLKLVRNLVHRDFAATALGVVNAMNAFSTILMQNMAGLLVDTSGISALYLVLAGLIGLGLLCSLFLRVGNRERVFGA